MENLLSSVGVKVVSETAKDLLCYCPFHHNVDTPAFNMSKRTPFLWKCQNGKCNKRGNIFSLLTQKGYTYNEARKTIFNGVTSLDDFEELMEDLLSDIEEEANPWEHFDIETFRREDEENNFPARTYLAGRGINADTYDRFRIGYSKRRGMIVVPVFDETQTCLGVIGRSIDTKKYMYSAGLTRGTTIYNINNAMHEGTEIILTEGSLDSLYIYQAGYKNVGAVLGSAISENQWRLIRKYFTDIICFFDNDDAGIALTESVILNAQGMGVSVVGYPDEVKDPGDLSAEAISEMIEDRIDSISILLGE